MLRLHDVDASYGESQVLHGLSISLNAGEVVALIGRNGVGKTTALRTVMGFTNVRAGTVEVDGVDVIGMPPHTVARLGCAYVAEDRGIFTNLTVMEHLRLGPAAQGTALELRAVFNQFPLLRERATQRADSLSGGERAFLAMAMALVQAPRLLLVDEMSEGVQPNTARELGRLVRQLADDGAAVLLVEQNARLALRLADRAYVMEKGTAVLHGAAEELLADHESLRAHLVV